MNQELLCLIQNNEDLDEEQRKYAMRAIMATEDMSEENQRALFLKILNAKEDFQKKFCFSSLVFTRNYPEEERVQIARHLLHAEQYYQASSAMQILIQTEVANLSQPAQYIEAICTASSPVGVLYATALVARASRLDFDGTLPVVQQITKGRTEVIEKQLAKIKKK